MQVSNSFLLLYATAFLAAATGSSLTTPAFLAIANRFSILDRPGPRKMHAHDTPLLGGASVFVVYVLFAAILPLSLDALADTRLVRSIVPPEMLFYVSGLYTVRPWILIIAGGGVAMFLIGLADDVWDVSIPFRLILEILVAMIVTFLGVRFRFVFPCPAWLESVITVLWIVSISNAINLIDGLDGLAAGVAAIASTLLAVVMVVGNQPLVALLLASFAGNLIGFLRSNFHPARIFLGSAGSIFIGYILAVACLFCDFVLPQSETLFPILVPFLVLGVPIYDTTSVVLIRFLTGHPVLRADQNHVHHRLLRLGMTHRSAVLFLYLFAFAVGVNAILLVGVTFLESLVILVQIAALFALFAVLERVLWTPGQTGTRRILAPERKPEEVAAGPPDPMP